MLFDRQIIAFTNRCWLLILLALVILGSGLGFRDPWPADEPRFVLIAKQMLESGHWLIPMRGGEIYADKPPLFMWGIVVSYLLTHSLKVAFLLPSLLASLLTLVLTWNLGCRLWNREIGFLAALMLLFTLQFTLQAKTAQIDALVTLFVTLGIYGFLRFLLLSGGWRWYYFGWFTTGLGIITKGVGILAAFILLPALWTHFDVIRQARFSSIAKTAAGPLVMLATISLWLLPMIWCTQHSASPLLEAYRNDILFHQTMSRYAHSWVHIKPVWYYLIQVIPLFWLPLSLFLPWLIGCWKAALKQDDRRVFLLLSYVLLVILFFSISPGKRAVYLTPATPAFALLASPWLMDLVGYTWPARLLRGLYWLITIIVFAIACMLLTGKKPAILTTDLSTTLSLSLFFLGIGLLLINFLLRQAPLVRLLLGLTLCWLCYSLLLYPQLNNLRTPAAIMNKTAERVPYQESLLILGVKEQHLLFAHQPIWHYAYHMSRSKQKQEAAAWIAAAPHRWVLGPMELLRTCFKLRPSHELGYRHRTRWFLVNSVTLKPSCHGQKVTVPPYLYIPGISYTSKNQSAWPG
ncbi:dolichyl-phosphate-mannose-protein mannosyltransferase [Legionella donaldsonii]|uniref:Dolichyl-phosphate-mannose-protein mannosyltransferase n=1 Tax=Legionella donaldsonii TaxID=45060 RepID=A0A378J8Y9_9GAMM|nr:glycosyltransferase family 39 protein [Legionella donaldsonii]STX43377.1 dolichyl-phosphate-mannose-protein mannosyltransferase [Legionella donaldsonii]